MACLVFALFLCPFPVFADTNKPPKLTVSGYGLIGNLELKRMLKLVQNEPQRREFFNANNIEDQASILFSRLTQDGYLHPELTAEITPQNGRKVIYHWRQAVDQPLPRPLKATRVHFIIRHGLRYYFDDIKFDGLTTVPVKTAKSYFIPTGGLLPIKSYRLYSALRLKRGLSSLTEILERQGYRENKATVVNTSINDETGAVRLEIKVNQGPKSVVRSVREEITRPTRAAPTVITLHPDVPYSPVWEQDFTQFLKTNYYHAGYPDTKVTLAPVKQEQQTNVTRVDLEAQVNTGPQVRIRNIYFVGEEKTKVSVMQRRARLHSNELLDPTVVDRSRYRLTQLGIFDSVGVRYDQTNGTYRDVTFVVKEGKKIEASTFFGFGTYELLRGGVEVDQHNLFGLAHSQRLRAAQSFKTTSADYTYTVPEVLGEDINVFVLASALRRKELTFFREEYGGGFGAEKYLREVSSDVSGRYDLRLLNASQTDFSPSEGLRSARVGAFIWDVRHDRRDHPLYPHRGYKIFSNVEIASDLLGGEVNYQRFDVSGSYHFAVGPSQWMHLGLNHGAVFTDRGPQQDLPFNRRFFPGGENSIRGYTQGEAAPRNPEGTIVGAESYLLGSIEFEQALTPKLSLVTFVDAVGLAHHINDYPGTHILTSVGGGLNWRTLVGPVRLEYGYNLDRRPHDPAGTVQFSVGFPF